MNESSAKLDFKESMYATGRRKKSIAKIWLKKGSGKIYVNGKNYEDYFKKKREMLPPDIEKDNTKVYNQNSKYNLANPISYAKYSSFILL